MVERSGSFPLKIVEKQTILCGRLMRKIRVLEGRDWHTKSGASLEELAQLEESAPANLPSRYLDLLAFGNGGEGPLAVNPFHFQLDPASVVADTIRCGNHGQADLVGFLIIGSNGGGEYIAFDTRGGSPWPIVAIDMVAGRDSAQVIAPDFDGFFDRIGLEADAV